MYFDLLIGWLQSQTLTTELHLMGSQKRKIKNNVGHCYITNWNIKWLGTRYLVVFFIV